MYKTGYDGSRIYVGLSSHGLYIKAFQSLGTEIVGYAGPRFVFIPDSMAQVYRNISIGLCHL